MHKRALEEEDVHQLSDFFVPPKEVVPKGATGVRDSPT